MKKIVLLTISINILCLIIPFVITKYLQNDNTIKNNANNYYDIAKIDLFYLDDDKNEVQIQFEDYIKGVVAAEMPALFQEEALKAQAVASRTYALRHIEIDKKNYINAIGQEFMSVENLQSRWGDNFATYYNKISLAVDKTQSEVIFYEQEPIEAVFHATSGGYTENSENVWEVGLPYLQSVDSTFDEEVADFITEKEFNEDELKQLLITSIDGVLFSKYKFLDEFNITEQTQAGYILHINIGGVDTTGAKIRQILGLRSTNFTIKKYNGKIVFTTKGYGHGAGMSQNGANYLAGTGYSYVDIINYYYKNVQITKL